MTAPATARSRARLAAAGLAVALGLQAAAARAQPADFIIVGGRLLQAAAATSDADAVAVRGDRILAVGRSADLLRRHAGPSSRVIDAAGATVMPGLQDAHVHFMGGSLSMARVVLDGSRDVTEMQQRIREWVRENSRAPWVLGRGWMYAAFGEAGLPDRRQLDAVVDDRPALLYAADGHSAWANTRALALAGITRDTPDPPNGVIVRDPTTGEPTGALKEAAMALVGRLAPEPTREERLAALRTSLRRASSYGIVRMHSLGGDFAYMELLDELDRAHELSVRFDVAISVGPPGLSDTTREDIRAAIARWRGERLAFGGVKLMLDGVIDSKTAALLEPYAADTRRGELFWQREDFVRTVTELDRLGVQISTHAIGDASIRLALDAYEAAARANGAWRGPGRRRHKIEHIEVIALRDVRRFRQLDVTASFQPLHANPDPAWIGVWAQNLGTERMERGFAWALLQRAGARIAFGSDFPVVTMNPWAGLAMATTRQYRGVEGTLEPPGGWIPAQRLSLNDAIAAYTVNVAHALNRERDEGSIAPGKKADLILLDRDLQSVAGATLAAVRVRATWLDGRMVHGSP